MIILLLYFLLESGFRDALAGVPLGGGPRIFLPVGHGPGNRVQAVPGPTLGRMVLTLSFLALLGKRNEFLHKTLSRKSFELSYANDKRTITAIQWSRQPACVGPREPIKANPRVLFCQIKGFLNTTEAEQKNKISEWNLSHPHIIAPE